MPAVLRISRYRLFKFIISSGSLVVQSQHLVRRVEYAAIRLRGPDLADVFVRREATQRLKSQWQVIIDQPSPTEAHQRRCPEGWKSACNWGSDALSLPLSMVARRSGALGEDQSSHGRTSGV